jgi:uncharacterized phage protein (TIGR02220 family)
MKVEVYYEMSDSFPIKIWSGILANNHMKKINNSLWEFIWLINKITKEEDGLGYVLKGIPIKIDDIANDLNRCRKTVQRHLKRLEKHGYINLKRTGYGYIITVNKSKKFKHQSIKPNKTRVDNYDQSQRRERTKLSIRSDRTVHSNYDTKDTNINNNIVEIIKYLNSKTGKKFSTSTVDTRKSITARIGEGFSVDDFYTVIDNKVADWLKDPEWSMYLRPKTLFGGKFESYLNQSPQRKGATNSGYNTKSYEAYRQGTIDRQAS